MVIIEKEINASKLKKCFHNKAFPTKLSTTINL